MKVVSCNAEEDNWDYNKIQRINNNKKNGQYLHATLLVNNAPIKFIIVIGSPVTLIPQRLFNKITEVEELKTNYKDVNDNRIDLLGQTKALVKTNSTTLQLPPLITKANITLLMGLDWMKRLGITLNTTTNDIKIHNIKMHETEKKILKLKNEYKDLFYNNTEIKDFEVKLDLKEDAKIIQQKGRPVPIHLQNQVAEEIKRLIKNEYLERATEITEDCFVSPADITVKKDKSIKIALDSRKLNEATIKKSTNAEHGRANIQNITEDNGRTRRGNMDNKTRFRLCLRSNQIERDYKKFMYFHRYRRRIYGLLPFLEMLLRTGGHPNNLPGTDRQNTGIQTLLGQTAS